MIRKPVVAGMFYPVEKDILNQMVGQLFSNIKTKAEYDIVISPHAGYLYSGQTAAFATGSLAKKKTFVILGPNHTGLGAEFSLMLSGVWQTPLGYVEVDDSVSKHISESGLVEDNSLAHLQEHSIEVQLPFLQYRFGNNFKFVPICVMNTDFSNDFMEKCIALGKAVASVVKRKNAGLIVSSDFSHYLPSDVANKKDSEAVEMIMRLDISGFFNVLAKTSASICGFGPIAIGMQVAKDLGLKKVEIIHHSDSGDVTGDYSSVVSYYAIGFR
ncbi:MAG: AmmeMemoRadiSam system protein B [Candidatus Aenigmarchaeota archaeon]|nr:AmmeMemoRadiSam system protein B [Candidatus Aenigmarchaeota archaeon]